MMKVQKYPLIIQYTVATLGDFTACISPIDSKKVSTYEENEQLYNSDDDVTLKQEFEGTK
jgi:hypothetical protein